MSGRNVMLWIQIKSFNAAVEPKVCLWFLDEDEILDKKILVLVDQSDIFMYVVALLIHKLNVRSFSIAAVSILDRQYLYVDLVKRDCS